MVHEFTTKRAHHCTIRRNQRRIRSQTVAIEQGSGVSSAPSGGNGHGDPGRLCRQQRLSIATAHLRAERRQQCAIHIDRHQAQGRVHASSVRKTGIGGQRLEIRKGGTVGVSSLYGTNLQPMPCRSGEGNQGRLVPRMRRRAGRPDGVTGRHTGSARRSGSSRNRATAASRSGRNHYAAVTFAENLQIYNVYRGITSGLATIGPERDISRAD